MAAVAVLRNETLQAFLQVCSKLLALVVVLFVLLKILLYVHGSLKKIMFRPRVLLVITRVADNANLNLFHL